MTDSMLQADGYVVVPDALSAQTSADLESAVARSLGVTDLTDETPTEFALGSVPATPSLWPVLRSSSVFSALVDHVGADVALLGGVDTVAVNGSESAFHRDSSYDKLPSVVGDDDARYCVVRALCYPTSRHDHGNVFRIVPKSHLPGAEVTDPDRQAVDLELGATDLVLFDARCVHAGAPPAGTKALLVLTFGRPNVLSVETLEHEHRGMREDGFAPAFHPTFAEEVARAGPGLLLPATG